VSEWWKQLKEKAFEFGLSENNLNKTKEEIVSYMEKQGIMFVPKGILSANDSCLKFLSSNTFLLIQDNKVSFAHQSILDCFLADKMLKRFYDGEDIVDIIGSKEIQTPERRYQVQMFMESLSQLDTHKFIDAGQKMFKSDQIRYFFKYVFFEVLNQIDNIDENIEYFIINNCENETYGNHIINNVILSRPQYIRLLRKKGILDKSFNNPQKKDIVFDLLMSMRQRYDADDIAFIKKYAFKSQEDDEKFSKCFIHDINQDTDDFFELRMEFYN